MAIAIYYTMHPMEQPKAPHIVFAEAVEAAGGQTAFAEICGCTQGNIWQLLQKKSSLPPQYVLKVEKALPQFSRHDLRPDLYPRDEAEAA